METVHSGDVTDATARAAEAIELARRWVDESAAAEGENDGDESAWDDFNPQKMAEDIKSNTAPKEPEQQQPQQRPSFDYSQVYAEQPQQPQPQPHQRAAASQPQSTEQPATEKKPPRGGEESTGGGMWEDVT